MRGKPIKKGQRLSPATEFKRGATSWMKGKKHSKETRKKMSLIKKGKPTWNKGKSWPKTMREKISIATKLGMKRVGYNIKL